jgi:hypothetical protein
MNSQNHSLLLSLFLAFPILIESIPAKAFNLVYKYPLTSPNYVNQAEYITQVGNKGNVWIDPIEKISPPSSSLLQLFKSQFPSYNFEASYTPIYGDFVVTSYQTCSPFPNPGFCPEVPANVGGLLDLDYVPRKFFDPELGKDFNDFPDPLTGQVRWVQWVTSNHKVNWLVGSGNG